MASRLSSAISSGRLTLNPLFDEASRTISHQSKRVKKKVVKESRKIVKRIRGQGTDQEVDVEDDDGQEEDAKSLSIDSYYITPTSGEETAEKLIQATNYFIITALVASVVIGIIIIWLLVGEYRFS
jgi:hypothetical protein